MTNLRFLDKDYLRLPTKNKVPLRKDWSLPVNQYYKEPLTIAQLLTKHQEYGIRLGLFIRPNYHLAALYFRTPQITHYAELFPVTSYTLTENGLYYFLLIKELPPNSLLKDLNNNPVGNFYGSGKIVIGPLSKINNCRYQFVKRQKDYLTFNSLTELLNGLLELDLKLEVQGKVEFDSQQQEWYCPKKLNLRWKRRNFTKAKLERERKLVKCPACSRQLKVLNLIKHLTKIHQRKFKTKKPIMNCRKCREKYSTVIKQKEHYQFYCSKSKMTELPSLAK